MDTDPGAALATYVAYLHRIAGRIRRQQKLRVRQWQLHQAETAAHRHATCAHARPLARDGRAVGCLGTDEEAGAVAGDGAGGFRCGERGATPTAPGGGRFERERPAGLQHWRIGSGSRARRAASDDSWTRNGSRSTRHVRLVASSLRARCAAQTRHSLLRRSLPVMLCWLPSRDVTRVEGYELTDQVLPILITAVSTRVFTPAAAFGTQMIHGRMARTEREAGEKAMQVAGIKAPLDRTSSSAT